MIRMAWGTGEAVKYVREVTQVGLKAEIFTQGELR